MSEAVEGAELILYGVSAKFAQREVRVLILWLVSGPLHVVVVLTWPDGCVQCKLPS